MKCPISLVYRYGGHRWSTYTVVFSRIPESLLITCTTIPPYHATGSCRLIYPMPYITIGVQAVASMRGSGDLFVGRYHLVGNRPISRAPRAAQCIGLERSDTFTADSWTESFRFYKAAASCATVITYAGRLSLIRVRWDRFPMGFAPLTHCLPSELVHQLRSIFE